MNDDTRSSSRSLSLTACTVAARGRSVTSAISPTMAPRPRSYSTRSGPPASGPSAATETRSLPLTTRNRPSPASPCRKITSPAATFTGSSSPASSSLMLASSAANNGMPARNAVSSGRSCWPLTYDIISKTGPPSGRDVLAVGEHPRQPEQHLGGAGRIALHQVVDETTAQHEHLPVGRRGHRCHPASRGAEEAHLTDHLTRAEHGDPAVTVVHLECAVQDDEDLPLSKALLGQQLAR